MNNLFDIFGPALIASFSSAVCYLVARRDFPPRDAVLVVIGVLIVGPVLAQIAGAWTGVSAGWLGLFFGFALIWTIDQVAGKTVIQEIACPSLTGLFSIPVGRAVIATIETVISLSAITSLLSLSAAPVATWVMQVTTHQAGLARPLRGWRLAQRIALAALAIFLMLNAVTPFITPDPPWLANLPLVVAIMAFLLAFGLSHIRAERARAAKDENP